MCGLRGQVLVHGFLRNAIRTSVNPHRVLPVVGIFKVIPELWVTTPLESSSSVSFDSAWKAPLILKAPMRW
jgi:hypothetical protein